MMLDPEKHVMICSHCGHINECDAPRCAECAHDAGTPAFRESAESLRSVMVRLGTIARPKRVYVDAASQEREQFMQAFDELDQRRTK